MGTARAPVAGSGRWPACKVWVSKWKSRPDSWGAAEPLLSPMMPPRKIDEIGRVLWMKRAHFGPRKDRAQDGAERGGPDGGGGQPSAPEDPGIFFSFWHFLV